NILQSAMASSERIFKLLDTKPEILSPADPKSPQGPGRVTFENVWFAYRKLPVADSAATAAVVGGNGQLVATVPADHLRPTTDDQPWDWVLRDVSLTIEPGETVAVVGH